MKHLRHLYLLVVASVFGCNADKLNSIPEEKRETQAIPTTCQTGGITGHVCRHDSNIGLAGASVYVDATDCNGDTDRYEAQTDDSGRFALSGLPSGNLMLKIESSLRNEEIQVVVRPGDITVVEVLDNGLPLCTQPPLPRLAVITGEWDEVNVLLDNLELPYDIYDGETASAYSESEAHELLTDLPALSEYDVLFVNCGTFERDFINSSVDTGDFFDPYDDVAVVDYNDMVYQNLRTFVQNGGSVYASDWSWPIAEGLKATAIDFHGDDTNAFNVLTGAEGSTRGTIEDEALETFMGENRVDIDLDLPGWAVIDAVNSDADVYVTGDVEIYPDPMSPSTQALSDRPLLVGFRPYLGGGYVIYTTFHYHSQPSAEMLDVLRYLIFQL